MAADGNKLCRTCSWIFRTCVAFLNVAINNMLRMHRTNSFTWPAGDIATAKR